VARDERARRRARLQQLERPRAARFVTPSAARGVVSNNDDDEEGSVSSGAGSQSSSGYELLLADDDVVVVIEQLDQVDVNDNNNYALAGVRQDCMEDDYDDDCVAGLADMQEQIVIIRRYRAV